MVVKALLCLLPIVLVMVLMLKFRIPTHWCGIWGWVCTALLALLFFQTGPEAILRASGSGILSSFPISLMVLFSILQITFMESTGALHRISVFIKTLAVRNKPSQVMLINIGAGTSLVALGATPVSVLPPIMRDLGYSPFISIAMPAIGFDALCTFSMLGAPLLTYCDFTGVGIVEAAQIFAGFLPVISTAICLSMLWILGGRQMIWQGLPQALLAGLTAGGVAWLMAHVSFLQTGVLLTGVVAGLAVVLIQMLFLKLKGLPIVDRSVLTESDKAIEAGMPLLKALSPWLILLFALLLTNFCKPIHDFLFIRLEMAVAALPQSPVKLRMLWNAYFWVLASTALSFIILKPTKEQLRITLAKWGKRGPKPFVSAAIFFAIGLLMNNTGLALTDGVWQIADQHNNMIFALSSVSADLAGRFYPLLPAPLGLFGGFLTGSEASAIAMFTKFNVLTAELLKLDPLIMAAATGVAGGVASVCTPAKLQNAAATIDAMGEEVAVMKKTFKVAVILVLITSLVCYIVS